MIAGIAAGGIALAGAGVFVVMRSASPGPVAAPAAPVPPPPAVEPVTPPTAEPPRPSDGDRDSAAPAGEGTGAQIGGGSSSSSDGGGKAPQVARPERIEPADPGRRLASRPALPPPPPLDERDPKALLRQGKLHEKSGDWKAARKTYQKLEQIRGHAGIALYQQARVALHTNDPELAVQLVVRSAGQPGTHKIDAKFLYGDALYKQGEFRRAKDIYLGLSKTLTGDLKATATRKVMAANRALNLPEDDGIADD